MIREILDLARWAPSADNSQPWRFEILNNNSSIVYGYIPEDLKEYDFKGNYSHFAFGCLLETIKQAASERKLGVQIEELNESSTNLLKYIITVEDTPPEGNSDLHHYIKTRTSNRFPFSPTVLAPEEKAMLEQSLPAGFRCQWIESFNDKSVFAKLNFNFASFAHPERSGIIEWGKNESTSHIPDEALGLAAPNLWMARQLNQTKKRQEISRNYLGADLMSSALGFFVPSLLSGCHVALIKENLTDDYHDYILTGEAFQKFWLTATKQGIALQMETGPLAFSRQVWKGNKFTEDEKDWLKAEKMAVLLKSLLGINADHTVMLARLGKANPPTGRSTRLSLEDLMYDPNITNKNVWNKIP